MPRRTPWLSLSAATLLALLLLNACSSGGGKINTTAAAPATTVPDTTPATTEPPSTTSTTTVESKVLSDLKAAHDTYYRLAAAPNPNDPAIAQYMSGEQLQGFRSFLQGLIHDGEVARAGDVGHGNRVVSVQGATAVVDECTTSDGTSAFYDAKTGRMVGPWGQGGRSRDEITMLLQNGTWTINHSVDKGACS